MKSNSESVSALEQLFVEELRDFYDAEKQLIDALPRMANAATSVKLRTAITRHLEQTKAQVRRLEQIFEGLALAPRKKHCAAMEGLIEEGQELIKKDLDDTIREAALMDAEQMVEDFVIASYGTLIAHATLLGHSQASRLFLQALRD